MTGSAIITPPTNPAPHLYAIPFINPENLLMSVNKVRINIRVYDMIRYGRD